MNSKKMRKVGQRSAIAFRKYDLRTNQKFNTEGVQAFFLKDTAPHMWGKATTVWGDGECSETKSTRIKEKRWSTKTEGWRPVINCSRILAGVPHSCIILRSRKKFTNLQSRRASAPALPHRRYKNTLPVRRCIRNVTVSRLSRPKVWDELRSSPKAIVERFSE